MYKQLFCTIPPLFSTSHTVAINVIVSTHVHIKRSKKKRQVSKKYFIFIQSKKYTQNLEMLDARIILKILNAKKAHGRSSFSLPEKMRNKKKIQKSHVG